VSLRLVGICESDAHPLFLHGICSRPSATNSTMMVTMMPKLMRKEQDYVN